MESKYTSSTSAMFLTFLIQLKRLLRNTKHISSVENEASFSFTCVTVDNISKEIKRLDKKKATQESDMPTKVIKQFPNLFIDFLHKNINSCLTEGTFPDDF